MKKTDTKNDKIKEHVTKTANSYKDDISFILYLQLLESLNVGDDNALHQICQQSNHKEINYI